MGLSNFFNKIIKNARQGHPVSDEHKIYENTKPIDQTKGRPVDDIEFESKQFQSEILAYALWKYKENKNNYEIVRKTLDEIKDVQLNEQQKDKIIETLKLWNQLNTKQERFKDLVGKSQTLINEGKKKEAYELVYNAYLEDHSDIELVPVIAQILDMFGSEDEVLEVFNKLVIINPQDAFNIEYRKALYLKAKKRFDEAIRIFEKLNTELVFAWNYYQIAIIENLRGNVDACFSNLKRSFELDPNLKQDAKTFPELANLREHKNFIALIA
jgi:tetratricopeptide (TPR) repeat protein